MISDDKSGGKNYSAMLLILPHIQQPPEIDIDGKTNDYMSNESLVIKWEEDSTNAASLSSFIPVKENEDNLRIINQCYIKGKINDLWYIYLSLFK